MLRALETSDRKQQITWRNQLSDSVFADLPGYISAGNDITLLPLDLLTDAARNLNKLWADHNYSKYSSKPRKRIEYFFLPFFVIFRIMHHIFLLHNMANVCKQLTKGCQLPHSSIYKQSAGVSTGIAVTASFSQQTEDRAFCPVVQLL